MQRCPFKYAFTSYFKDLAVGTFDSPMACYYSAPIITHNNIIYIPFQCKLIHIPFAECIIWHINSNYSKQVRPQSPITHCFVY